MEHEEQENLLFFFYIRSVILFLQKKLQNSETLHNISKVSPTHIQIKKNNKKTSCNSKTINPILEFQLINTVTKH